MPIVRLQRYLSQAGVSARRKAETLITGGHVKVNGRVVTELGTKVDSERDIVQVDGGRVAPTALYYYLLNKPKGCVTTVTDPLGRKTVLDLIVPKPPVPIRPVGRLDYYTEGVLLLTNDGELAAALLSPKTHAEKTYHVKIRGPVSPRALTRLREGVRLDDGRMTRPAKVDVLKFTGAHTWLVISLTEGQKRQIHRMAMALGHQVLKLQRVAFGGLTYYGLRVGEHRTLEEREVHDLRRQVGLAPDAGSTVRPVRPAPPRREAPARKPLAKAPPRETKTRLLRKPRRSRSETPRPKGRPSRRPSQRPSRRPSQR
jgi:23S rRNA pseudouridine2605 synthase